QALFSSRMLKKWEFEAAYEWLDLYRLPEEVIMLMVQYCIDSKGSDVSFKYISKVALSWAENNITTPEAAEEYVSEYQARFSGAARVLAHLGIKNRAPTSDELALYNKWTCEFGYTIDTIIYACRETTCIANPNMRYLDKVLTNMHSVGIVEKKQVAEYIRLKDAYGSRIKSVLSALGIKEIQPPVDYFKDYDAWIRKGFRPDSILLASRIAVSMGASEWSDLKKAMEGYESKNLFTPAAIRKAADAVKPKTSYKKTNAHYSDQHDDNAYEDLYIDLEKVE
ncbi:MAG TPA: DnaD domain protein, partial [Clostridia bacterium]|nr:DnaD domain protein [Clostridia bacterium]